MSPLPLSDTARLSPTFLPSLAPDLTLGLSDCESIVDGPPTPENVRSSVDPKSIMLLDPIPFYIPSVSNARAVCAVPKAGNIGQNASSFASPVDFGRGWLFPGLKVAQTFAYANLVKQLEVDTSFTMSRAVPLSSASVVGSTSRPSSKRALPDQDVVSPRRPTQFTTSQPSLPSPSPRSTSPESGDTSIARISRPTIPNLSCEVHELMTMFTRELNLLLSPKTLYWHKQDFGRCSAGISSAPGQRCSWDVDHPVTTVHARHQLTLMVEMNDASAILTRLQSFVPSVICTEGNHVWRAGNKIRVLEKGLRDVNRKCALWDTSIPEPLIQLRNWLRLILSATNRTGLVAGPSNCKVSISRWKDVEAWGNGSVARGLSHGLAYEWYRPDPQLSTSDVIRKWLSKPMEAEDLKTGYLYVYWHPGSFGLVKIGYTAKSIEERLDEWRQQCGHDAKACMDDQLCSQTSVPNVKRLEDLVHAELRPCRVRETGCRCNKKHIEWFKATQEHVKQVIQKWTRFISHMARYQNRTGGRLRRSRTPTKQIEHLCTPLPIPEMTANRPEKSRQPRPSSSRQSSENGPGPIRRSRKSLARSCSTSISSEEDHADNQRSKRRLLIPHRKDVRLHTVPLEGRNSTDSIIGSDNVEIWEFAQPPDFHPLLHKLLERIAQSDQAVQGLPGSEDWPSMQLARYTYCSVWRWRFCKFLRALVLKQKAHELGERIQEARIYVLSIRPRRGQGRVMVEASDLH